MRFIIPDLFMSFIVRPYYLDKKAVPEIGQDAGYSMLDTGLKMYYVDLINKRTKSRLCHSSLWI